MKDYIMVMRDSSFWLVGPFPDQKTAAEWGYDRKNNPEDDPRWQTIKLAEVPAGVEVRTP